MIMFVLFGLWTSDILYKRGRSPRLGMALGLALNVLGFALAMSITPPPQEDERKLTRRERLWLGFSALILAFLVWKGDQLPVDWELLAAISLWVLIVISFFSSKMKGWSIGNLPSTFWLCVAVGATLTMFTLGIRGMDRGAYGGAWLWVLGGLLPKRAAALD